MNKRHLVASVDKLTNLQRLRSFCICGLYLSTAEIEVIRPELTPDIPSVNAVGRLLNIPVFDLNELDSESANSPDLVRGKFRGLSYTYVKLDVVD